MKLGTIKQADGTPAVIVAVSDTEAAIVEGYRDLADLIETPTWREIATNAQSSGTRIPTADVHWLPPLRRPGKILGVALNNSANPDRIMQGPDTPAMFVKPSSSLIGHGQPVLMREIYGRVHPEPELTVVIGKGGADLSVDEALDHVFGYTIMNDLTSPTMRGDDTFHYRAIHPDPNAPDGIKYIDSWVSYPARYKGSDTFGPLGPWVVTTDDIPDPHVLRIQCRHDGNVVTDDNTGNLRFSVAEVLAFTSQYLSLEPGDVIAMGTALRASAKGGAVQNVDLVKLGGTIEVEIENIGVLSNPVGRR